MKFLPKSPLLIFIFYFLTFQAQGQITLGLGLCGMPQWNYMTYTKSYLDSYDANNDSYFTFGGGFHADLQVTKWFAI